ncbi:MAG: DinB family protein [Gemmatales bacterium]
MAHLATARLRWLYRLGIVKELPPIFPKGTSLSELRAMIAAAEAAWIDYLAPLDDAKLASEFEYTSAENKRYRWTIEGLLTQVNGHAWYHRGQIAMLVADLGGKAVDTDYIFFCKLEPIEVK